MEQGGDKDVACARESAREWSNELTTCTPRAREDVQKKKGRASSAGSEEDGACTAHQEKGHESTAGEGTREQSRRRDTRAKQEKGHESTAGEDNSTTRKQNMTNRKGNHD